MIFCVVSVGTWPGPEILAICLIAENQPFDSTWHKKFRCNRHGRLMAASGNPARNSLVVTRQIAQSRLLVVFVQPVGFEE
jgi:hypothetical protein